MRGDVLDCVARTEDEAHLRHIHGCATGLYKLADALLERCNSRDALIFVVMNEC